MEANQAPEKTNVPQVPTVRPAGPRHAVPDRAQTESTSGRIVVAVDGSPASIDALRWAARQAALTGASLVAVTCWEIPLGLGIEFPLPDEHWDVEAQTVLHSSIEQAIGDTRITVHEQVMNGSPQHALTLAASDADLLVVGSRGHGSVAGMVLGSVSEYLAAHAPCPVVIVRHTGQATGAAQQE